MSQALIDALGELIDEKITEKLTELGVIEAEKPKGKGKAKAKPEPEEEEDIRDQVLAKMKELVSSEGKEAAVKLLSKFKVKKLPDVPDAKLPKLLEAVNEALGTEEAGDDADELFGD